VRGLDACLTPFRALRAHRNALLCFDHRRQLLRKDSTRAALRALRREKQASPAGPFLPDARLVDARRGGAGLLKNFIGIGCWRSRRVKGIEAAHPQGQRDRLPDTAPGGGAVFLGPFEAAARLLAVEPITARVRSDAEIEAVIASLGREQAGLVIMPDSFMQVHQGTVISLTARNNLPAIGADLPGFAREGGLLSYGANFPDIFRRAAPYVDRILRGANPADLPVQAPTKYELVINLKTAKALGLDVPWQLQQLADEVIE
jgi:hypothetical protein